MNSPLQEILARGRAYYITNADNQNGPLEPPNAIRVRVEDGILHVGPKAILERLKLLDFIADNKRRIMEEVAEVKEVFESFRSRAHELKAAGKYVHYSHWADAEWYAAKFDVVGILKSKSEMEKENDRS